MDRKLHKAVSELDEFIALCRKRLDRVLSGLNWTENVTLRDIGSETLEQGDSEDEDDPPLPQSFGWENSVVIGVDQLKAIIRAETASIAKKFSDIQLNCTREQKREIYDYVIKNTKKLSEPEVKVTVSNNHQPTTNMTFAQVVAKAKSNAKIQRRKYSSRKPTHIEEVREMLNLQMQALNQLYKPKPEQPHTNTYRRSKSCEGRSVFRRPSLDMVIRVRPPSSERPSRSKSREGGSPFRRPSLDMINSFRAPSCQSTSQSDGPSESSYRQRNQSRSREYLACGSPRVDSVRRSRSRSIENTESARGAYRGREQSVHLRRPSISDSVDMLHRMSGRMIQTNEECADRRTPLRVKITASKESDRGGAKRQSLDLRRTIRDRVDMSHRMSDRMGQTNDEPAARAHQSDERRGRDNRAKNSTACRRYSQSGGQGQSGERRRNPTSPCTSGMHKESGRRDLNDCRTDLSNDRQDRRSLKQRRDKRYQGEENTTEKDKMRRSGRSKGQRRDKKTRRHKRSRDKVERQQKRDRARGDKHKSHEKRYPSCCSSESRSQSSSSNKSSSRCKAKRRRANIKREHKSRSHSKETRQSHRWSKKSAKRSSHATVGDMKQTEDSIKCSRRSSSPSRLPKPSQHRASPKKSQHRSKSRAQDERRQPSLSSSIEKAKKRSTCDSMSASDTRRSSSASQEPNTKRSRGSATTRPTFKDIDQVL